MFDIGWGELLIVGGVALVVIKPKDLPGVLRTVGQTVGKIRRMAGEFQGQFQDALREANLDEARKTITGLNESVSSSLETSFNPIQTIRDEIKGAADARNAGSAPAADGAPAPDFALPEPPPVPDLTPEQIQAAFSTEPLGAALPEIVEPAPEKPKRRRKKKADEPAETTEPAPAAAVSASPVSTAPASAPVQPSATAEPAPVNYFEDMPAAPSAVEEPPPARKPRAPRKTAAKAAKATDDGTGNGEEGGAA